LTEGGDEYLWRYPSPRFKTRVERIDEGASGLDDVDRDPTRAMANIGWTFRKDDGKFGEPDEQCSASSATQHVAGLGCFASVYDSGNADRPAVRVCSRECPSGELTAYASVLFTDHGHYDVPSGTILRFGEDWVVETLEPPANQKSGACEPETLVVRRLVRGDVIFRRKSSLCVADEARQIRIDRNGRQIVEWEGEVWIDGAPLTKTLHVDAVQAFNESMGKDFFFAESKGKWRLYWNNKPLDPSFEEIRVSTCCLPEVSGMESIGNGYRLYAKRGRWWYLVEFRLP
jgi:hypothetical protein